MNDVKVGEHPSAADIAAFIDGGLSAGDRARLIRHFSDCEACRREVMDVRNILEPAKRRVWWMAPAAAAAVAGLVFFGSWLRMDSGLEPRLREGENNQPASFAVIAPSGTSAIDGGIPVIWESVGPNSLYTLLLMDSAGNAVWAPPATRDTVLVLPDSILFPGELMVQIEAVRPDGLVLHAPTQPFRATR